MRLTIEDWETWRLHVFHDPRPDTCAPPNTSYDRWEHPGIYTHLIHSDEQYYRQEEAARRFFERDQVDTAALYQSDAAWLQEVDA